MGYSGFSLIDSDTASDMFYNIAGAIAKSIDKELKGNLNGGGHGYNTEGCVNAAMFFDECIINHGNWDFLLDNDSNLVMIARDVLVELDKLIGNIDPNDRDDDANLKEHLSWYNKLRKKLNTWIEKMDSKVYS